MGGREGRDGEIRRARERESGKARVRGAGPEAPRSTDWFHHPSAASGS